MTLTCQSQPELMFGRLISTALPSRRSQMAPVSYQERVRELREKQMRSADQRTHTLPPIPAGTLMRVLNKENKTWFKWKIIARNRDRSCQFLTRGGRSITCNHQHLREYHTLPPCRGPSIPSEAATSVSPKINTPFVSSSNTSPVTNQAIMRQTRQPREDKLAEIHAKPTTLNDSRQSSAKTRAGCVVH